MTRDEIVSMQPGPELDVELAVKLFGWSGVLEVRPGEFLRTGVGHLEELPNYSASWGYMRLVVEAMAAKGYWLDLDNLRGWSASFNIQGREREIEYAVSNDAQHAVAIAALLALEGEHAG